MNRVRKTKRSKNIVDKLSLRQVKESQQRRTYYEELPTLKLHLLLDEGTLMAGHVFMGFTRDGQYLLSYTMKIATGNSAYYMCKYIYNLHWWLFNPCKKLKKVSEVRLFGGHDILDELFLLVCQWPTDNQKILIHGTSRTKSEDCQQCFITITAVPSVGYCSDCHKLREESISKDDENSAYCLRHTFAVHAIYCVTPSFPCFNPRISLKLDGLVIINTGDSLFVFEVTPSTMMCVSAQRALAKSKKDVKPETCDVVGDLSEQFLDDEKLSDNIAKIQSDDVVQEHAQLPALCSPSPDPQRQPLFKADFNRLLTLYNAGCISENSDLEAPLPNTSAINSEAVDSSRADCVRDYPASVPSETVERNSDESTPSSSQTLFNSSSPDAHSPVPYHSDSLSDFSANFKDDNSSVVVGMVYLHCNKDDLQVVPFERDLPKSEDQISSMLEFLSRENQIFQKVGINATDEVFVDGHPDQITHDDHGATNSGSFIHEYIPLEVWGSCHKKMNSVTGDLTENVDCLVIKQQMIDLEQFINEVALQCCNHIGETFMAIDDYDVQILEVFPETYEVLIRVIIEFVSEVIGSRMKMYGKGVQRVRELSIMLMWNVLTKSYTIVRLIDKEQMPSWVNSERFFGKSRDGSLFRFPDLYARSIKVLTNKPVFKGTSLDYLVGPYFVVCL